MEKLRNGLRVQNSSENFEIAFEELIIFDLTPTEIYLLTIIEMGIDTVEDLSQALGLSVTTVTDLLSDLKSLGISPIFYDAPRENLVDQALFTKFIPEYSTLSLKQIAMRADTSPRGIRTYMDAIFSYNPLLIEDYTQNLIPELVQAGYTIDTI
ncbi:MarR family transcriptional regulator [Candidatus Woesebacteria bacterium]|nr:MarR family transcriptional regulator [Candidatus Woesebacteria bacterium]